MNFASSTFAITGWTALPYTPMDINYSVVTKPNRNKHILLKDLNVKQLNLW